MSTAEKRQWLCKGGWGGGGSMLRYGQNLISYTHGRGAPVPVEFARLGHRLGR